MSNDKELCNSFYPEKNIMALFVNLDNLGLRGKSEHEIGTLVNALNPWGKVAWRRAYTRFGMSSLLYRQLYKHRFDLVELEWHDQRNANGICISVEIMEMLQIHPEIRTFIIAGGDSYFLPLIKKLHAQGRLVIGVGNSRTSKAMRHKCDTFLSYEDIVQPLIQPCHSENSAVLKFTIDEMRTVLRKRNLYPPDMSTRHRILQNLSEMRSQVAKKPHTFQQFQDTLFQTCAVEGISRTSVRNCLRPLMYSQLVAKDPQIPLKQKLVTQIASLAEMETTIVEAQVTALLDDPTVITDPLVLSEVIWQNCSRVCEMKKLMAKLAEPATALVSS